MSEKKHVVCFNGGSSSIKVAVKEVMGQDVESVADFNCQGLGTPNSYIDVKVNGKKDRWDQPMKDHATALHGVTKIIAERFPELNIVAVGHRVVHGGPEFKNTTLIDGPEGAVTRKIAEFASLAPLHNPANLHIIQASMKDPVFGQVPNAAIFDTQFHSAMADYAKHYAVPNSWLKDHNIQRYGFHGASYTYIAQRFAELNGLTGKESNLVVAHLGNGCSMAKVVAGRGADTSMGTTPLEGLVMGTRSGDIDAGALELMAKNLNCSIEDIVQSLNKESGLWGLYNRGTKEMHEIRQAAQEGDKEAEAAIDVAAYRAAKYFCSYLGTMKDPKGIVFTGGIGENEGYFRRKVLDFMSLYQWNINQETIDLRNEEVVIAESQLIPGLKAWVIPTDEEKVFALEAVQFAN